MHRRDDVLKSGKKSVLGHQEGVVLNLVALTTRIVKFASSLKGAVVRFRLFKVHSNTIIYQLNRNFI